MQSSAYETYLMLIKHMTETYAIRFDVEHKFVHEFFEEKIPLFKLMFGYDEARKVNCILVSFQLDVAVVDAIQWFTRLSNTYPGIRLADSYFKDDRGETFLGQSAEVLRMYKIEQQVITKWSGDQEDAKKLAERKIYGRTNEERKKVFTDKERAIEAFNNIVNGDDDDFH